MKDGILILLLANAEIGDFRNEIYASSVNGYDEYPPMGFDGIFM
jgi:hypothetical protein